MIRRARLPHCGTAALICAVTCLWLALISATPATSSGENEAPGTIRFTGKIAFGACHGEFHRWWITRWLIDERHPERSEVDVAVDLTSLDTANWIRDRHLKSRDFLDTESHPIARVSLRDVRLEDSKHFRALVQLDLHGHSRSFPMRFEIVDRTMRLIAAEVTLKRSDFAVGSARSGLFHLEDEISVAVTATIPPSGTGGAAMSVELGEPAAAGDPKS